MMPTPIMRPLTPMMTPIIVTRDPLLVAGHLITKIHSIVSRNISPLDSGMVTVASVSGELHIDEDVLFLGVQMLVRIIDRYLGLEIIR